MVLYDYTDLKIIKLLGTETRKMENNGHDLGRYHTEIGRFLAYHLVDEFDLDEIPINHPLGIKTGQIIKNEEDIFLIVIMRSGLYLAEGIRTVFSKSPCYYFDPKRNVGLSEEELIKLPNIQGKTIILIDSVINTGGTIIPVISQLKKKCVSKIMVVSIVGPRKTIEKLNKEYPNINFYIARLSEDSYVGKGKTDTGNRLFNTFSEVD